MVYQLLLGLGDIWVKCHCSHNLLPQPCSTTPCKCSLLWDLPDGPRTQLFPIIPDCHCTVFLSHTQNMDLACWTCENHVCFMYLPVCCLPTKLGRRLFEIAKFWSLSDHIFYFCTCGCCLWAKDSLQTVPYYPVTLISCLWRILRANLPNANVQPRTRLVLTLCNLI